MRLYGVFSIWSKATMSRSSCSHRPRARAQKRSSLLCAFLPVKVVSAGLLAVVWFCIAPRALAADKAPDWMHDAARQTLPTYPPETVAVILLDERITTVKDNGEIETLYRRAYKILRPEARDQYGTVFVNFDTETKLSYLKAWAIPPTGPEYQVNEKDAIETGLSEDLYSDVRHKLLQLPAVEPGSIVGYEYVQKKRPYIFDDNWWFQEE